MNIMHQFLVVGREEIYYPCLGFISKMDDKDCPNFRKSEIEKCWDYPCLGFISKIDDKDSPDFYFFLKGRQDSPNLSFASIDWDWDCPQFQRS